jgi:hypothetical protein
MTPHRKFLFYFLMLKVIETKVGSYYYGDFSEYAELLMYPDAIKENDRNSFFFSKENISMTHDVDAVKHRYVGKFNHSLLLSPYFHPTLNIDINPLSSQQYLYYIIQVLPKDFFFDPFQLINEPSISWFFIYSNGIELERMSSDNSSQQVGVFLPNNRNISLSVPFHLRYHKSLYKENLPLHTQDGYKEITLPAPLVVRKKEGNNDNNKQFLRLLFGEEELQFLKAEVGQNYSHQQDTENYLINLPVAVHTTDEYRLIELSTMTLTIISFILLLWFMIFKKTSK